ncbi:MAG: hypothetical protein LBU50_04230 [Cellulomonas sp.]|jgi:hypothetical protein|nr:hypothetical protein [Cellulomonas sp.]
MAAGQGGAQGLEPLRTTVVVDYQNVHLVGHGLFVPDQPRHETLIDPLRYAQVLLEARNRSIRQGYAPAVLGKVLVFRGHPSPEHDQSGYARNLAHKEQWERDRRVEVTLRPLKYRYARTSDGQTATDSTGRKVLLGVPPQEKGVDVLCALAVVREAQDPAVGLVVLASSDTDLAPALDEARRLDQAKIETACWYDSRRRLGYQLHPTDRGRPLWNTRLTEPDFHASHDQTLYR